MGQSLGRGSYKKGMRALPALANGSLAPLLLLVAGLSPATQSAASGEIQVVAEDAGGTADRRPLTGWRWQAGEPLAALALRFEVPERPAVEVPADERLELEFVSGERLGGRLLGGTADTIAIEIAGAARLSLPVDSLFSARFPARIPAGSAGRIEPAEGQDRLYLRVGERLDRVDGAVDGFDARGLVFEGLAGRREHPWSEVAAFFVAPLGAAPAAPPSRGPAVLAELTGGGRLAAELLAVGPERIRLATRGGDLDLPPWAVLELSVADGRLAHLGDLAPALVDGGRPFGDDLGMVWSPRVDRAVHGGPLSAGGVRFARGLGVLAPTRMEWDLAPGWERFEVDFAIDDSVERMAARGSVIFAVEVDGREVWRSTLVRGGQPARPMPGLALDGARRLALVVEDGGDGFLGDRANWLRPRLLRSTPP